MIGKDNPHYREVHHLDLGFEQALKDLDGYRARMLNKFDDDPEALLSRLETTLAVADEAAQQLHAVKHELRDNIAATQEHFVVEAEDPPEEAEDPPEEADESIDPFKLFGWFPDIGF